VIAHRIEHFCRRILSAQLERVHVCATFDAASAVLAESPIDVVLLDLNLGGVDGMALLQSQVAASFHTVVVSADIDEALRTFEYGVLDFVPKPFTEQRLEEALRRVANPDGSGASLPSLGKILSEASGKIIT
jgi:DNA-binding NtrC family response regulator